VKIKTTLVMLMLLLGMSVWPVHADAGPKPELRITLINPPNEPYVLDLLVEPNCEPTECWIDDERFDGIDPTLIALLEAQQSTQWVGVLSHGVSYPVFGNLQGREVNGDRVHTFTYRLPDSFKIVVVTLSGKAVVSDVITRDAFMMNLRYDLDSNTIIRPQLWKQVLFQFGSTLIPTVIVELILLGLFGLWSSRNLKVTLIANFLTQVLLSATMGWVLIQAGLLAGFVVYLLMEGIVMLIEALIYWKAFDKKRKTGRKILYAITANFVSFIVGFMVMSQTYLFLLQL
jgi:hypothetical protein